MSLESLAEALGTKVDYDRRTLYLVGEVDQAMAELVAIAIPQLDAEDGDLVIHLNSGGGAEDAGYAIYDVLMRARNQLAIEGFGAVDSIAAVIFQAANSRRLAVNSEFMIHNGSAEFNSQVDQGMIISLAQRLEKNSIRYYEILAHRSGNSVEEIQRLCNQETFYSAVEAIDAGFADEIIEQVKEHPAPKKRRKRNKK